MNLYLIGYRGCGKSAVAAILAEQLGLPGRDADAELERRAGRSIAEIFAADGEPAFRDLEEQVVAELCRGQPQVVALGGGAILRETTRRRLAASGVTVWLRADPAVLAARISADAATRSRRPALTAAGTRDEVAAVLAQRTPLYQAAAQAVVDTDGLSPADVAAAVLAAVRGSFPAAAPPEPPLAGGAA